MSGVCGPTNLTILKLWRCLPLGKLQENLKSWVENEYLGDNQAPLEASETEKVGRENGGGKKGEEKKGRRKNGDRTTGGEEQRESEEPEGVEV